MTFAEWALTDAEKLVRVDLTAHDGTSQVNKYIASRYYYDDVNDVEYLDRLIDPLIIRRSMGGAFGRPEATVGAISIDNSDRELDDWIDYAWHGWSVVIRLGDPTWDADDSRWSVRFRGLADKMEAEDNILTLFTRDKSEKLDRPIVERPLNGHPQAFKEPLPIAFGAPKNVSPPFSLLPDVTDENVYAVAIWDASTEGSSPSVSSLVTAVYENGKETTKSLVVRSPTGGGATLFKFNVNDPEGKVTCDPVGSTEDPTSGSTTLLKPGEILKQALTWEVEFEPGIAQGGSTSQITLDSNASDVDDFYNGSGTPDKFTTGSIQVMARNSDKVNEFEMIDDYDGSTKVATFAGTLSFSVNEGDLYIIVNRTNHNRLGALSDSDIDSSSFDDLDSDAAYDLGIWVAGMNYLDLFDRILPGGFFYYWNASGEMTVGLLEDPSAGTSVFTIDQYESRGKIRLVQDNAPLYRARVGYDRNWTVMATPNDTVSLDRAQFLSREYIWETEEDLSIKESYQESVPQDFPSFLTSKSDAQTEAARLLGLFGVARKHIMVEGLSGLFSVDLNDVVTLKDDTYGLDNGKDYRVVMMEERPIQGTVDVELWG